MILDGMKKIYIVMGATGEYPEIEKWNVAAYTTKRECIKHVEAANDITLSFFIRNSSGDGESLSWNSIGKCENPYDPHMRMQSTGTNYYWEELELLEEFD